MAVSLNGSKRGRPIDNVVPTVTATTFTPHLNPELVVDVEAVESAIENAHVCLLDARTANRYAGIEEPIDPVAGHIPSALSFPWPENLDENKCFLSPEQLRERFASIPTASAISYCGSGVTAAHNMLAMAYAGLPLPKLYAGSWSHWITLPDHIIATNP